MSLWRTRVDEIHWELFDRGTEAFTWFALEELVKDAKERVLLSSAPKGGEAERFAAEAVHAQLGKAYETDALALSYPCGQELEKPFKNSVFFWQRQSGPKGDLVDDEMGRVLQVPGWSNIFTQPIINRIEMLSTGVRTDIGIKVFGPDLATIDRVCKDIEAAVKPITAPAIPLPPRSW